MFKNSLRKKILSLRKKNFDNSLRINFQSLKNIIKKKNIKNSILGFYYPVNYEINCLNLINQFHKLKHRRLYQL